jgi:hypothetical protein
MSDFDLITTMENIARSRLLFFLLKKCLDLTCWDFRLTLMPSTHLDRGMRRSVTRGWKDISSANRIEDTRKAGGEDGRRPRKGRAEKRVEEDKAQEDLVAFANMYGSLASGSASSSEAWIRLA